MPPGYVVNYESELFEPLGYDKTDAVCVVVLLVSIVQSNNRTLSLNYFIIPKQLYALNSNICFFFSIISAARPFSTYSVIRRSMMQTLKNIPSISLSCRKVFDK